MTGKGKGTDLAMGLTAGQRRLFDRDGFLILDDFVDRAACERLRQRALELIGGFDPDSARSVFSTTRQTDTTDAYFLESGGAVRFFFEEGAFDEAGALVGDKALSINKIGHALHDRDPVFDAFSRTPDLAAVVRDLGVAAPLLIQSMYIFKQPRIGGEVSCHQDATFLYTDPLSVVGLWFALEDATRDNGCLFALPGGHRSALRQRFRRNGDGGVTMDVLNPVPWPDEGYVPLEAKAGSLVLLHGLLPHRSGPNRSAASRHAYTLHVIDATAAYPADNWLQRAGDDPPRGF